MITVRVVTTGALLTDPNVIERVNNEIAGTIAELGAYGQRLVVQGAPRGVSAGGGGYAGSISTELRGTPVRQAIVSSSVFYSPVIESGRHAGAKPPPGGPIKLWVVRRLHGSLREVTEGLASSLGAGQAKRITAQASRVAFLVARSIGRKGIPAKHVFQKAAQALLPVAQSRFDGLQERIVRVLRGD